MGIALPCQSINAPFNFKKLGVFRVAAIGSGPPTGGIIVDGNTWTVSNQDPSGIDVSENFEAYGAGTILTIETATGSNQLTVSSRTNNGGHTTFVGVQSNAVGVIHGGQGTGLWVRTAATVRCVAVVADPEPTGQTGPTGPGEDPEPTTFCDLSETQLADWVEGHQDQAQGILAYMEQECPECDTLNWLRGYISAIDPNYVPIGG